MELWSHRFVLLNKPPHSTSLPLRSVCHCVQLSDPINCSPPGSSVHGTHQARILEWAAMPSSRDLPNPGIKPFSLMSLALAGSFTWEAQSSTISQQLAYRRWHQVSRQEGLLTGGEGEGGRQQRWRIISSSRWWVSFNFTNTWHWWHRFWFLAAFNSSYPFEKKKDPVMSG